MDSGFWDQLKFYFTSKLVWIGVALGVVITIIAILIRPLTLFRYAYDPLQLVQPIMQLRFGLINFNWRLPLIHLGFILSLAVLAPLALRFFWQDGLSRENAVFVGRVAAFTGMAHIWWLRVDAIQLLLWYGMSTWISIAILSWLIRQLMGVFSPAKMRIKQL